MAVLANLARMVVSAGGTGTLTLSDAVPGFLTFDQAGVANGANVSYAIASGINAEVGRGVYNTANKTLTRGPLRSTNGNAAINVAVNAQVFITAVAEDFNEKADLASPPLTGNPTAPTQAKGDRSMRLANTAFVGDALADYPRLDGSNAGQIGGYRNKIINGNFSINQRGYTTNNGYNQDRWKSDILTGTQLVETIYDGNVGGINQDYGRFTYNSSGANAATSYHTIRQRVENVTIFNGKTATLSFVAWASANTGIQLEVGQFFGTNGAAAVSVFTQRINLTTVPTRYDVTFPVPTTVGKTIGAGNYLEVLFFTSAGSNFNDRTGNLGIKSGVYSFCNVQLCEGSVPTPFETRTFAEEYVLCQRYCQKFDTAAAGAYPQAAGGATAFGQTNFAVQMRAIPSLTIGTGSYRSNLSNEVFTATTVRGTVWWVTQGSAAGNFASLFNNHMAEAEL